MIKRILRSRTFKLISFFVFTVLPAVILIYIGITVLSGKSQLEALEESGVPVRMADLIEAPIPDEENAAIVFLQVADTIPDESPYAEVWKDAAKAENKHQIDEALAPLLLQSSFRFQVPVELLQQAVERPSAQYPIEWTEPVMEVKFRHFAKLRSLVLHIALEALLDARAGKMVDFLDKITLCFRIAEDRGNTKNLIGFLVDCTLYDITISALEWGMMYGDVPEDRARQLSAMLTKPTFRDILQRSLIVERAMGNSAFDELRAGKGFLSDDKQEEETATKPGIFYQVIIQFDQTFYLKQMEEIIRYFDHPFSREETERLERANNPSPIPLISSVILLPVINRADVRAARNEALLAQSQTALGLDVYRQKFGEYSETLDDLEKISWPQVRPDPFSGKPLVYRKDGSGYLLYSIGANQTDDGGTVTEDIYEGDLVWRQSR